MKDRKDGGTVPDWGRLKRYDSRIQCVNLAWILDQKKNISRINEIRSVEELTVLYQC